MRSAVISFSWLNSDLTLRLRRFLVVAIVLALAWPFLRPVMAEMLVDRGIGVILQGDYADANRYISRAMWLDPDSVDAADLQSFFTTMTVQPAAVAGALSASNRYVSAHPDDANVRWDRMILEMRMSDYAAALADAQQLHRLQPDKKQLVTMIQLLQQKARTR